MNSTLIVVILSLLLGIRPIATDLYLPALPVMTEALDASMHTAQLTLSALLLAFGISQLAWGPLSDRFGRRPVLLAGLAIYTVAAAGGALSASMGQLVVWRTVEGAGMGAAVMCGRAVVRDLYPPETGPRVMSKAMSGLGVIGCLSAPVGSVVTEFAGWRAALSVPALFGVAALALIALRFDETLAVTKRRKLDPAATMRTWGCIARHPTFRCFALLAAASYAGLFTFLAGSSFVFIKLFGLSRPAYGGLMLSMSITYIVGTALCRRLLARYGLRRTVALAGALSLVGGSAVGGLATAGVHSPWAIMLPFYLFVLGHAVHQSCGQSGVVGPFPEAAGAASALSGFLMMVAVFATGDWLGHRLGGSVLPMTGGLWFWSVAVALTAWTSVQRHGEPPRPGLRGGSPTG